MSKELIENISKIVTEQFNGDIDRTLHHLYKIQKHNKYIYEEHIRMERYDKAGIVKDKIKSNNEIIDILNNLNQNKDDG